MCINYFTKESFAWEKTYLYFESFFRDFFVCVTNMYSPSFPDQSNKYALHDVFNALK